MIKISTSKQDYTCLGKALSEVEDDGEVKIMFFKSMDHATKFKLVASDLSSAFWYLITIVPESKKVCKGIWYCFRHIWEISDSLFSYFFKIFFFIKLSIDQ